MFATKPTKTAQKGATTVEYAVVITFLLSLLLTTVLVLVNPGKKVEESILPSVYKNISDKAGKFASLPE